MAATEGARHQEAVNFTGLRYSAPAGSAVFAVLQGVFPPCTYESLGLPSEWYRKFLLLCIGALQVRMLGRQQKCTFVQSRRFLNAAVQSSLLLAFQQLEAFIWMCAC